MAILLASGAVAARDAPSRGAAHSTSGRVTFPARRGRQGVGSRPGLSEHSERIGLNHLGRPVVGRPAPSHLPARERRLPGVTRRSSAPFRAGKRTRQPAGRIRPLPPEQDPGVTTPFPLYVRRPAHDSSGLGVKYRLQRRFASTAVADVALSSQPAVALRRRVRRHRRAVLPRDERAVGAGSPDELSIKRRFPYSPVRCRCLGNLPGLLE